MVNVTQSFGGLVNKVKNPLELLLVVLILINFAPTQVLPAQLNNALQSVIKFTKIHVNMQHVFVRFFLWLVLLWSCCYHKDMNLFFLLSIYFLTVH